MDVIGQAQKFEAQSDMFVKRRSRFAPHSKKQVHHIERKSLERCLEKVTRRWLRKVVPVSPISLVEEEEEAEEEEEEEEGRIVERGGGTLTTNAKLHDEDRHSRLRETVKANLH